MAITELSARATTFEVIPGKETPGNGRVRIEQQRFADIVECDDARLVGTNRLVLDLDIDPSQGSGRLWGAFTLDTKNGGGGWHGELVGTLTAGKVTAAGIARGRGEFEGAVLRLDFQQVDAHPFGKPPCPEPKAFFEIRGLLLG